MDWLEIDGEEVWKLEKTNMYWPILVSNPLPSDAWYWEDSVWFGEGDLLKSQKEKERLEVLQRHDWSLWQEAAKKREKNKAIKWL